MPQVEVLQTPEGVFYDTGTELLPVPCQWFAMCTTPATATEPHPILGDVPICPDCAAKNDRLKETTR